MPLITRGEDTVTILVITTMEYNKKTGRKEIIISHGVDLATGKNVILPTERPEAIGAVFSEAYGEYVLEDN